MLVLDSLEDPQNVGTLLRSAEAAAVHGVVYPTHRQAPLTPSAIKASAGAVEHLLLAPVDDLPGALADLHVRGLRIVGADADAPLTVREADLRGPIALVVGSEGQGLGPAVRRRCDLLVRIPMRGVVGSLNASVAGSILLYEASTQRGIPEAPAQPAFPEPTADQRAPAPEPTAVVPAADRRSAAAGSDPVVEAGADAVAEPDAADAQGPASAGPAGSKRGRTNADDQRRPRRPGRRGPARRAEDRTGRSRRRRGAEVLPATAARPSRRPPSRDRRKDAEDRQAAQDRKGTQGGEGTEDRERRPRRQRHRRPRRRPGPRSAARRRDHDQGLEDGRQDEGPGGCRAPGRRRGRPPAGEPERG